MTSYSMGKVCRVCGGPVYNEARVLVCQACRGAIAAEQGSVGGSVSHPGKGFGSRAVLDKALETRRLRLAEKKSKKSLSTA